MKKWIIVFLSVLLTLSVTISFGCAETVTVSDETADGPKVPSDALGSGIEGATLEGQDAFCTLQSIEADGDTLLVSYYFQNNGTEEHRFTDLFWLSVFQTQPELIWEYKSPLNTTDSNMLKNGESAVETKVYSQLSGKYPVTICLSDEVNRGKSTAVYYNPKTRVLGTQEDAGVWYCFDCREFLISDYCTNCGARNPNLSRLNADGSWVCSNCNEVRTTNFCTVCGEKKPEE